MNQRRRSAAPAEPRPPLDRAALERLALGYVGRFATTEAKLAGYLGRKLAERGWAGERAADIAGLVRRFAELGYVDDASFAELRTRSLLRRGYGPRRVGVALRGAGIVEADASAAMAAAGEDAAERAARAWAQRKRLGPFAPVAVTDPAARRRAFAAMLRAGHGFDVTRRILAMDPDELEGEPPPE